MTSINRRQALGSAAVVMGLSVVRPCAAALSLRPTLLVYDGLFPAAMEEARRSASLRVPTIDSRQMDLGHAWRGPIGRWLEATRGEVSGITLWMDSFICETFGRDHALRIERLDRPLPGGLIRWSLA